MQALQLPHAEQLQLAEFMPRVNEQHTGASNDAESVDDARGGLAGVQGWLSELQGKPEWEQLKHLDRTEELDLTDEERAAVDAARTQLLDGNPRLSIRRAIAVEASARPMAVVIGLVGLGVALVALARGLFRVLF